MSISGGTDTKATAEKARAFFDLLARPIEVCSTFYVTYWLSDVRGVNEAAFDFQRLRDHCYTAFQDYGIYSVVNELSNIDVAFYINDKHPQDIRAFHDDGQLEVERRAKDVAKEITAHMEAFEEDPAWIDDDENIRHDLIIDFITDSRDVRRVSNQVPTRANVVKTCNLATVEWDAFDQPEPFLDAAAALFRWHGSSETHWSAAYGGEPWAAICEHLLRADDFPPTAWVDQSWAIQHNNSNWLDKIRPSPTEQEHLARIADVDKVSETWMWKQMLEGVLEWAREGDMDNLYPIAASYTEELSVNLRRLARRVEIDLPASEVDMVRTNEVGDLLYVGDPKRLPAARVVGDLPEGLINEAKGISDPAEWVRRFEAALPDELNEGDLVRIKSPEEVLVRTKGSDQPGVSIPIEIATVSPSGLGSWTPNTEVELDFEGVDFFGPLTELEPGDEALYIGGGPGSGEVHEVIEQPDWASGSTGGGRVHVWLDPEPAGGTLEGAHTAAIHASIHDLGLPDSTEAIKAKARQAVRDATDER